MVRSTSSGLSICYYCSFGFFWIIFYPSPHYKALLFYLIISPVPTCLVHNCETFQRFTIPICCHPCLEINSLWSPSMSSTSSIFTDDHLGGVSGGEGDGDSEWVGRLGGIGEVGGLGYTGVGRKGIGAGSSIPKGPGTDDSISGVSLPGGIYSLGWEDGHLGKSPSSKIAWVEQNITFPCVWRINL